MAVRAQAQVHEAEPLGQRCRVHRRRLLEILGPDRHRAHVGRASRRKASLELREVPVGVAVGRDALVDLEDRDLLPRHLPGEVREHGPGRPPAGDGEREEPALRDRGGCGGGEDLRTTLRDCLCVGEHFDFERHGYAFFSSCPPNCLRMADRSRFAKSSMLRDAKRE